MRRARTLAAGTAVSGDAWLARGLESAGDIAYAYDLGAGRVRWSAQGDRVLGLPGSRDMVRRDDLRQRVHPADVAHLDACLERHVATGAPFEVDYRVRAADGAFVWVHDRGAIVPDAGGARLELYGVMRVVSPHDDRAARLERMANFDELTGHFNLRRLREQLELAFASARRSGQQGAFLSVVIDDLKLLRDVYGGDVADAAVIGLGQQLDRCLRDSDVTGRTGPDSFGIILDGCPAGGIDAAVAKIMATINGVSVTTPVGPMQLAVSIGAAPFPGSRHTAPDIIAQADRQARGRRAASDTVIAEEPGSGLVHHDLAIIDRVRWCLDNDGIQLVFQPVVTSATGRVAFYECLLRPVAGSGLADEAAPLVRAAERVGLIRNVDRRVLELVLARLDADDELVVAVNVSGLTTLDPRWLRRVVAKAHARPDLPKRLIVEITETAALQDLDETARFVATLRDMGCRVALDDFGAGHTSFRNLKALPVDLVKIDGAFITGLTRQPADVAFVRALTGLAEACGKATVAECVEDEATAQVLKDCGVDYLQGYHYGRPAVLPERSPNVLGARPVVRA
ncbi:MAG: EAL domain-containing protein [Alphaproteobacteria bacterium]